MEDLADKINHVGVACGRWRSQPRDGGGWSELPGDILYQVMCRLPSIHDCLSLTAVCHHCRGAVHPRLPCSLPKLCLAVSDGSFFTFEAGTSVLKPQDDLCHGSYRGTTGSQLISDIDSCGTYNLVNPFTGRERLLPVLPSRIGHLHEEIIDEPATEEDHRSKEMIVRKLVVYPDGGLVAAIVGQMRSAKVALCVPDSAAAWSWSLDAHDPWRWYADMTFFDGKLYALTKDGDLLAMEVGSEQIARWINVVRGEN